MRRGSRLPALGGLLCLALTAAGGAMAASAFGAVGARLDAFVPSPARNGRALAISGSTAYLSSQDEMIDEVNLATHAAAGSIDTLGTVPSGFGALALDRSGALWGAEYLYGTGQVYRVDLGANTIEGVFNAYEIDPKNEQIDGLAIDPKDGTLWLSGEGEGAASTIVYHVEVGGSPGSYSYNVLGEFTVPFGNSGIADDGEHLWLADIDGRRIVEYGQSDNATGTSFPTGEFEGSPVEPEGLALDHCTFPGKLALWTYGSNPSAGPLVAYELGPSSDRSGCPQAPPGSDGARYVARGTLAVGFPRSTVKLYRGLRFAPHVRIAGHEATLWLSWSGRGHGVSARFVDWTLDRLHGSGFAAKAHVSGRVALNRDHPMRAKVHFSNRHTTTIKACFHA